MSGYIGVQPVPQATQIRDSFTATSGQTSFATGGYTPNFLDVYLNGVKLSAADYTASNGSDVVLASGAATGDILEVVAFTTFNSASSSIDDNGNATAITIDSSENVMVGKTSAGAASTGFESRSSGYTAITRDGGQPLEVRRLTSDGVLIDLRKDGTTVGSIYNGGGNLGVNSSGGLLLINDIITPTSGADATHDIGRSSARYKNAYLSGGVYLGGTGSANKLEDYEEGTFALNNAGDSTGVVASTGKYVKIGRQVTVHAIANVTTNFTSQAMDGLPFAPSHVTTFSSIHGAAVCIGANVFAVNCNSGLTRVEFRNTSHAATAPTTGPIRFTMVYQTT